jgi:exonuclease SbcD
MFKFIHAADIHLDSPLRGLDKYEGAPVEAIRGATRRAFTNLVSLATTERVDFVILAGDIYDGTWPDYNTGLFFVNEIRELDKAGIPLVMLSGNHDAASRITSHLTLPPNNTCVLPRDKALPTDEPGTITFDRIHVAVHGQGYACHAEMRNLAAVYPPPKPGYFNIGVLHTALDGREGHQPYAPCALAELLACGYDYWALGHIHKRERVNDDRHPRVEFPGNIQGRHVRETGPKGCLLVTVDAHGRAEPEFRALDVFRWEVVAVDASEAASIAEAKDAAVKALADARDQAEGRPLAARVTVSCRDTIFRRIADNMDEFRFDLAGQAGRDVWVEKIKLALVGEVQRVESTVTGDAASELRAVLSELLADPAETKELFASGDCGKLKKVLPSELCDVLEANPNEVSEVRDVFIANRDEIFDRAAVLLRGGYQAEEEA